MDINNAGQLLCRERLEDHHVVEAVDELRLEVTLHSLHHLLRGATCPQVGGQDNDGVAEVHSPPLAVGEPTFVEHLQQHVEHLGVRLLHLVEQDHGVGTTAHGLRQLTTLIVANISGRGTDEARDRVLLAILRHVDTHHGAFVIEEESGQCLGQLRLTHTRRAEEQERTQRTVRVGNARAGTTHSIRHRLHSHFLADHLGGQFLFHGQQFLGLALHHLASRNARPRGHDLGDGVGGDFLRDHRVVGAVCNVGFGVGYFLFQFGNAAIAQLSHLAVVTVALSDFGFLAQPLQFLLCATHLVDRGFLVGPACLEFS